MSLDKYFFLTSLAAILIGMSKGGLPSIGSLSVPLLSLIISPVTAAVLLLPIYIISDVVGVYLYRKNYSLKNLQILVPAGVLGVVIGWLTASFTSDIAIKLMIGLIGVIFCLSTWLRKTSNNIKSSNIKKGLFWGALSGFTSFISHSGAPPFQVYILPQKLSKIEFAGTATIFFALVNLAKITPYQMLRPYSMANFDSALVLIPFAILGTVLGAFLTKRIPDRLFFKFIQISLFLISLKLITDVVQYLIINGFHW